MKKWFRFFFLSFFSHKAAKEGAKRGYTNVFLGFMLALSFLWISFFAGDMLPFAVHFNNSPDFVETVRGVFANADTDKRIDLVIDNGDLKLKGQGADYAGGLLINTLENDEDRQAYSVNGYNVVVDLRAADTPCEVYAYCLSNDGKNTEISYQDYLTLSEVARLNFDFKLKYTSKELVLDSESVKGYIEYLDGLGEEKKELTETLASELAEGKISEAEYNRAIYEAYFESYYPAIDAYESSSKIPLLRNYYYHNYISQGLTKYILIFDDYMSGSFETKGGREVSFYGFYSSLENGELISDKDTQQVANDKADGFIKSAFKSNWILSAYAYLLNTISLAPFIALMIMVAALLPYSILRLCGVESISSLGAMIKIVGSFVWFSGVISAVITVTAMFFVNRSLISLLPLVLFFVALVIRAVIFALNESRLNKMQPEQQQAEQTEV